MHTLVRCFATWFRGQRILTPFNLNFNHARISGLVRKIPFLNGRSGGAMTISKIYPTTPYLKYVASQFSSLQLSFCCFYEVFALFKAPYVLVVINDDELLKVIKIHDCRIVAIEFELFFLLYHKYLLYSLYFQPLEMSPCTAPF